jgi:subtilisin family serine protease
VLELSGTSFAAPAVAGVAADLLALHPGWTPDQVKGALMASARDPGAAAWLSSGAGELWAPGAAAAADPPNPNDQLETYLIPDPAGGPTPVFDAGSWGTTVEDTGSWGTGSWGTGSWGTGSWGTAYWSSQAFLASGSWGTSVLAETDSAPADNAAADAGGAAYWMTWPPQP